MKYGTWNYGKWITVIIPIATMMAQPTFPSTPNQAPIGGLGVLAAAGGALALKKLWKNRKR